jgi:hypothetical protein
VEPQPCEKVAENPISIAIDTDKAMIRLANVIFLFLYGAAVADSRESFDFVMMSLYRFCDCYDYKTRDEYHFSSTNGFHRWNSCFPLLEYDYIDIIC